MLATAFGNGPVAGPPPSGHRPSRLAPSRISTGHDAVMKTNRTAPRRVLVTGGAGEISAYACRVLAAAPEVAQVVVADRNDEKASKLATDLGPKTSALALDISDADSLSASLEDVDIVQNCAGPFYGFGREVLSAAIAAGTDYLDVTADPAPGNLWRRSHRQATTHRPEPALPT